ncbi:MAG: hypothetical protein K9M45_13865 [Kiritimatiellales bacterium]|nr:hypothetical protein [Kiritimatiellales bacterium]
MKKTAIILAAALSASLVSAESVLKPINEKGYGTISGRVQSLSMYRDFENTAAGDTGANTSLGFILGYTSPEVNGLDAGLAFNFADELYSRNNSVQLLNDDIHVLNEAWARYTFSALNLTNTTAVIGRRISNGEVFRADDYRQKSRSIEAIQIETKDIPNTRITAGHAIRLSNWIDTNTPYDRWDFNDFGEVFGAGYDTKGVTWSEGVYTGFQNLEIALFDAYAWDVSNLIGTRAKWACCENSALVGYYRHENDVGRAATRNSDAYGISLQQKVGGVTIEPGYFGVRGSTLRFQETTTGINHPLGVSMMLYSGQFNGDSDTAYLKAVTKIKKTVLYALYNYTWHGTTAFDGQELNLVAKQPIIDNLTVAVKCGIGYRDNKGADNTTATDARLFLTYAF